jgi:hypothetical protein
MGGGMKAGVNVWKALNDNSCTHNAWRHLADHPLTEADMPRNIADGKATIEIKREPAKTVADLATAAAGGVGGKGGVRRRITTTIVVHEDEDGEDLTELHAA